jgi:DNA-binding transcriptional regulator/RsmH inhibitor MraZ
MRKGLVLAGSFLVLVLGFLAARLKQEAGADPMAAAPNANWAPKAADEPSREPLILPLNSGIELMRLDVQHGDAPAWLEPGIDSEEAKVPSLLLPPPPAHPSLDVELAPLCPRANLLQPVPVAPVETTVAKRPPSEPPAPAEPRPLPLPGPARLPRFDALPFTGTYSVHLAGDQKALALPQAVRDQLEDGPRMLFLRGDPDGCLWIGTTAGLERLAGALDPRDSARRRLFFAQTERCRLTADGQLLLPENLARLEPAIARSGVAVLIGAGDHFELWEASRWRQFLGEKPADAPSRTERYDSTGPFHHVTVPNQRFTDVALRVLGDPRRWEEIYRLNPSFNPSQPLPVGTILRIPPNGPPESKEPDLVDD